MRQVDICLHLLSQLLLNQLFLPVNPSPFYKTLVIHCFLAYIRATCVLTCVLVTYPCTKGICRSHTGSAALAVSHWLHGNIEGLSSFCTKMARSMLYSNDLGLAKSSTATQACQSKDRLKVNMVACCRGCHNLVLRPLHVQASSRYLLSHFRVV
jgi:hypothetical protein